jgi:hypothetical protein
MGRIPCIQAIFAAPPARADADKSRVRNKGCNGSADLQYWSCSMREVVVASAEQLWYDQSSSIEKEEDHVSA